MDDPLIAGRAIDLSDVGSRVLRFLAHPIEEGPLMPAQPVILLAEDLTPSDTAGLDPALVLGFCTAGGGPTSHSAIIARALGIPAVVGAGPAYTRGQTAVQPASGPGVCLTVAGPRNQAGETEHSPSTELDLSRKGLVDLDR